MNTRSTTRTRLTTALAVGIAAVAAAVAGSSDAGASERTRADELAAIADYAADHGLTGLSPASMQPVQP